MHYRIRFVQILIDNWCSSKPYYLNSYIINTSSTLSLSTTTTSLCCRILRVTPSHFACRTVAFCVSHRRIYVSHRRIYMSHRRILRVAPSHFVAAVAFYVSHRRILSLCCCRIVLSHFVALLRVAPSHCRVAPSHFVALLRVAQSLSRRIVALLEFG